MKISVIIPVYNVEKYLDECVDSILEQDFQDYEIILVNDGSTDNSGRMCDAYAEKYSQIKVIHKENGGLSDARNFGIKEAKGDYLIFLDSDDTITKNSLKKISVIVQEKNLDMLSFGMQEIYNDTKAYKYVNLENKPSDKIVSGIEYIRDYDIDYSACVFVLRRDILVQNDVFFLKGVLSEDYEFPLRLYKFCNRIYHTKEIFYNYVIRKGSLSRRNNDEYYSFHHKSMMKIIKNLSDFIKLNTDKDYNQYLSKHITKIKLVALGMLLKSTLSISEKRKYYLNFKEIGMFSLTDYELIQKTKKQEIITRLVKFRLYYFIMLILSNKKINECFN